MLGPTEKLPTEDLIGAAVPSDSGATDLAVFETAAVPLVETDAAPLETAAAAPSGSRRLISRPPIAKNTSSSDADFGSCCGAASALQVQ